MFIIQSKTKMKLHPSLESQMAMILNLLEKHEVKSASLFGSAVTGKFNNDSDVDFLISLKDGLDPVLAGGHLWDLYYDLKELLNREVDIVNERSLKNPFFIE